MVDPTLNRLGIERLETIVQDASVEGNAGTLKAVHEVLQRRSTARAGRLLTEVNRQLRRLRDGHPTDRAIPLEEQASLGFDEPVDNEPAQPLLQEAGATPDGRRPTNVGEHDAVTVDVAWIRERTRERAGEMRLRFDESQLRRFATQIQQADSREWFELRSKAERLALLPGFDELIALDVNTIEELAHQTETAIRVLRDMSGRAILADEVGLGKTIEAGLILKELLVRRLIKRILILCPASLVDQWRAEMREKFLVDFSLIEDPGDWAGTDKGIASIPRARHPNHRPHVASQEWDLVIVDEAHKAKNHRSVSYQTIQEIERDFILLLTATPLQNELREFYNLVTLIRPGQFGTWREFKARYMATGDSRIPRDPEGIRDVASQVMIRNKRANVDLHLPRRRPHRPSLELTEAEAALYEDTARFLRELYREGFHPDAGQMNAGAERLALIRLAQRLCSSSPAVSRSLAALADNQDVLPEYRMAAARLSNQAAGVTTHTKLRALQAILGSHADDRVVVFSEHRPTLKLIVRQVEAFGRPAFSFHGGLNRRDRARVRKAFRETPGSVFVSSRAGTEGLNLQFAHVLVNYELPWNPLLVEQRIGRLHRIGQQEEVFIYNLAAKGTVEDRILEVLQEKIHLFELVVGELDLILGRFRDASELERRFAEAWLSASNEEAFDREVEAIGHEMSESFREGKEAEELSSFIAPEDKADRLEREFAALNIPTRIRLAYGTRHMNLAAGVEAHRIEIGLEVPEIMSALRLAEDVEDAGRSEYGPTVWVRSATSRGRAVSVRAAVDSLPITILEMSADVEAPLIPAGDEL